MRRRTGRGQGGFAPPRRPPPIPRKALRSPGPCVSRGGFRAPRPPVYAPAPGFGACVCACALVWLARVRPLPACAGGALRAPRGGDAGRFAAYTKHSPYFVQSLRDCKGAVPRQNSCFVWFPPSRPGVAVQSRRNWEHSRQRFAGVPHIARRLGWFGASPPCEQCRLCQAPFGA